MQVCYVSVLAAGRETQPIHAGPRACLREGAPRGQIASRVHESLSERPVLASSTESKYTSPVKRRALS